MPFMIEVAAVLAGAVEVRFKNVCSFPVSTALRNDKVERALRVCARRWHWSDWG